MKCRIVENDVRFKLVRSVGRIAGDERWGGFSRQGSPEARLPSGTRVLAPMAWGLSPRPPPHAHESVHRSHLNAADWLHNLFRVGPGNFAKEPKLPRCDLGGPCWEPCCCSSRRKPKGEAHSRRTLWLAAGRSSQGQV